MDKQLDILAFGAHPDDVELGCGGTIAKHIALGKKIGIVDLTQGELGTRGNAKIRLEEASKAAKVFGIDIRHNLKFKDGFFQNDQSHQIQIVEILRKYRPKIVLTNAIADRHPDHKRASELVSTACFLSGLTKIETNQKAWRPNAIYHYIQFQELKPDFVVDITDFIDVKKEAVLSYESQFYNPKSKEPETIISSKSFLESVIYRAENLGRLSGVKYAEGFTVEKLVAVDSLDDIK